MDGPVDLDEVVGAREDLSKAGDLDLALGLALLADHKGAQTLLANVYEALGNTSGAADLRNVTQPAFSRRIQALEQWVGAKLIDRATFPTRLTQAGEEFRKVAISLVEQIADARSAIGESPTRDRVRLALSYALASTKLVQWWPGWSGNGVTPGPRR